MLCRPMSRTVLTIELTLRMTTNPVARYLESGQQYVVNDKTKRAGPPRLGGGELLSSAAAEPCARPFADPRMRECRGALVHGYKFRPNVPSRRLYLLQKMVALTSRRWPLTRSLAVDDYFNQPDLALRSKSIEQ